MFQSLGRMFKCRLAGFLRWVDVTKKATYFGDSGGPAKSFFLVRYLWYVKSTCIAFYSGMRSLQLSLRVYDPLTRRVIPWPGLTRFARLSKAVRIMRPVELKRIPTDISDTFATSTYCLGRR